MKKYKTELERIIQEQHKKIHEIMLRDGLYKLADNVVKNGIEPYKDKIYLKEMIPEERAFFFFYLINKAVYYKKFKFAAEMHRNFIQEVVKVKYINILRPFILISARAEKGAYSYAAEITIDELKKQIEKCEDPATKELLIDIYNELTTLYQKNLDALKSSWNYYKFLELKDNLIKKFLYVLALGAVVVLAWLIGTHIKIFF